MGARSPGKKIYLCGVRGDKREEKVEITRTVFRVAYPFRAYKVLHVDTLLETVLQQIMEERKIPTDPGRMGIQGVPPFSPP